jgi:hypothetical protein
VSRSMRFFKCHYTQLISITNKYIFCVSDFYIVPTKLTPMGDVNSWGQVHPRGKTLPL